MGLLNKCRTYLGGNLETCSDTTNWRAIAQERLGKLGIKAFNPMEANFTNDVNENNDYRNGMLRDREDPKNWDTISKYMENVVQKDLRLIDIVDFVILNFEFDKPTYGTTHELIVGNFEKKPLFIVCNNKRKVPLWIMGIIKEKYIYESLDDALTMISRIDSGEQPIDSRRWRLLKDIYR